MKITSEVRLTKEEFEQLLVSNYGTGHPGKSKVTGFLHWDTGKVEFRVELNSEPAPAPAPVSMPAPERETVNWFPPPSDPAAGPDDAADGFHYCRCISFQVTKKHGWVDNDNLLHTVSECESPPADAPAALSASSTGEHGTVERELDDDIPF